MQSDEATNHDQDDDELSPYPSTVVNAGGVPTSWVPKWFMRWVRRPKPA
ncbi:MAG: hypothetical protein OXC06_01760 [Acidimicrobiaceae bacterium]|nr:hypothetical protein [Acidimicrobiaceae bacterium]